MKKKYRSLRIFRSLIIIFVIAAVIVSIWLVSVANPLAKSQVQIGSSYMTMNNEFYPVVNEQVANYIDERNDFLYNRDPALNVDRQVQEIHSFMHKHVNAILLNPVDGNSAKLNQAIVAAHKQGIKIVIVDSPVKTKQVDCTITSDNYEAGVICAKQMLKQQSHARILLLEHSKAVSAVERINGFLNTIKKTHNKNYQIVGHLNTYGQSETTYPLVKRFIKKHNFDSIMALNDRSAIGALAAIHEAHLQKNIFVYSVDGSQTLKKFIANNSQQHIVTVAQYPIKMGNVAVKTAYRLVHGKKVPKKIVLPVKLITSKNVNDYSVTGWQ